jgi:hypothetical protein
MRVRGQDMRGVGEAFEGEDAVAEDGLLTVLWRVQRSLGYDPHLPFGGIDYDHLGAIPGTMRAGVSLAAPVIAARPKRLTRQGR